VSTRALVPLLWFVAAGCDRGELVLLPVHGGAAVELDAATAPDHSGPEQPQSDSGPPSPPTGGTQFECSHNDQCGGRRPYCDTRIRRCVECLPGPNQCPWPTVCEPFAERCALPCQSDTDCSMTAQTRCDPNRHVCVGCTNDDQCAATGRFCELWSGQCVECLDDNQCDPPWRFCSPNRNECVECRSDDHCPPGEACGNGGRCFVR
jgi:hypothetical protein